MEKIIINKKKKLVLFTIIAIIVFLLMGYFNTVSATDETNNQVVYLSDIPYDTKASSVGWGSITMDKTTKEDGYLSLALKINGNTATFKKGIFAHAKSTVVFDISNYSENYDFFTTYYGVSAHRGGNGSVKISIYTSNDKQNWTLETEESPSVMTGNTDAKFVKIPIKGKKYIKLYADPNGSNGADHAVYGDAKLIKDGYTDDVTRTVENYDTEIKEKYLASGGKITKELEKLILQREFIYQAGSFQLRTFVEEDPEKNKEALDWILEDTDTLRLFLVGGKPKGTYPNALKILYRMYNTYNADWNSTDVHTYQQGDKNITVKLKDVYRTMMIASALEHSGRVYLWINGQVQSTPENRYDIYKELYNNNLIESRIFETLTVEEMRWVINTIIDDEEIKWLNNYTRTVKNGATGPYSYINYTFGYNYSLPQYYSEENKATWDAKYKLSDWGVTYGDKNKPKLWIVFEQGAVCGGLSKTGACVWGSYKGLPNTCVSQPGHCAYAMYSVNANGDGVWSLGNNVGGWGPCGNTEQLNSRMMNDWKATEGGWMGSYIVLAQAAQNEYETYEKAQIQMMLARVYSSSDFSKQEELYRKVLETEKINFGAWESLIKVYIANSEKTEEDYIELAKEIAAEDALMYYPKPMVDLLAKIERKLSSPAYLATFNNIKTTALKTASANANKSIQSTAVREVANYLLGLYDSEVATFSFDGENANSIVLAEKYQNSEQGWDYSLDGGATWSDAIEEHSKSLEAELNKISTQNDIKVHIIGVDYSESNIYTIDITKSDTPTGLYNNDLENKVIGATDAMQWRFNDTDEWTSYKDSAPNLTGNTTVSLRVGPTGTRLPSDEWIATFTEDGQPDTRKYIPIWNDDGSRFLEVHQVSSEATSNNGHGIHALDGNIYTIWHSAYNGSDRDRYIIIKLKEPKYISALEYVPRQSGSNGRVNQYSLFLSMDGNEWIPASTGNWANSAATKSIELEESMQAQYVKLQAKTNYGDGRNFITALMINLFEDKTGDRPRASIEYSTVESTAKPVVVTLKPKTDVTITNNNGSDTYTFKENGEFTFEFVDKNGKVGTATARVNWMKNCEFSFDGDTKNTIILSEKYAPNSADLENLVWEYCIDGENWIQVEGTLKLELSNEEIEIIKANNNIQLRVHVTQSAIGPDEYTVEITGGRTLPNDLYANDLENRIIGMTQEMEWRSRADETEEWSTWTTYEESSIPEFLGNKTVEVRYKAIKTTKEGPSRAFTFTEDNQSNTKKYIPIKYLTVENYSSQTDRVGNREYATNAIDGNINTMWHTNREIVDTQRHIVIKLDKPRYISHVQYMAKPNYLYGILKEGNICVSLDGETWSDPISQVHGDEYTSSSQLKDKYVQEFSIEEPVCAQYIKFQCTQSYDYIQKAGADYFVSASMINLFEDTTKEYIDTTPPTVDISYNTLENTKGPVVATIRFSEPVEIIRDGIEHIELVQDKQDELTYTCTFKENFGFTLKFKDLAGNRGEDKQILVNWIQREPPKAKVKYSIENLTNQNVVATVYCDEEAITVTNNNGKNTYTFVENDTVVFEYITQSYLTGSVTAKVDWIDKVPPTAQVSYSTTELTNKDVVSTIKFSEEVIILNKDINLSKQADGTYTYTFDKNSQIDLIYQDLAGNEAKTKLVVNNIDKLLPKATIEYSTHDYTTEPVVVTIKPNKDVTMLTEGVEKQEDGTYTYTFTSNNNIVFKFVDALGNIGSINANVSWILNEDEPYFATNVYQKETNYINGVNEKTTFKAFKQNIKTNQELVLTDKDGKVVKEEELLTTGMIITEGTTKKKYTIVVKGDVDCDGEVTANDLARVKLYLIGNIKLEGAYLKAANLDSDDEISANDLARMKMALIGLINL